MGDRSFDEQLTKYLTDAHAIELQALEQLRIAPRIAGDDELSEIFAEHCAETEKHERFVREELEHRGAKPSRIKDLAGRLGAWNMALFAQANPDTPGKLAMHAYSYEHLELATYELLRRFAERAGDDRVAQLARRLGADERAMADRIAARWDIAAEAALREKGSEDLQLDVVKYLRDAHAMEGQSIQMLQPGKLLAEFDALARLFRDHLRDTRYHQRGVDRRLDELGHRPARLQASAMRGSALQLGGFFKAQPDTPAKIAGFAYAFEALEAAAYELLLRAARRAGDEATAEMAAGIAREEHATAERVAGTWDEAVSATLRAQGIRPATASA